MAQLARILRGIDDVEHTPAPGDEPDRLQRAYLPVLRSALTHPVWAIGIAFALLIGTGVAATALKTDFLGAAGADSISVSLTMPAGTDLAETDAAAREVEDWLIAREDVDHYQVTVGSAGGVEAAFLGGGGPDSATFAVTLACAYPPGHRRPRRRSPRRAHRGPDRDDRRRRDQRHDGRQRRPRPRRGPCGRAPGRAAR